jgi:hypothetical protein
MASLLDPLGRLERFGSDVADLTVDSDALVPHLDPFEHCRTRLEASTSSPLPELLGAATSAHAERGALWGAWDSHLESGGSLLELLIISRDNCGQ